MDKLIHAPEEWRVDVEIESVCVVTDDYTICEVLTGLEAEKDAHLIAAAPDMYKLLKQAKEILFASNPKAEDVNDLWDRIQACLEAIK